MIDRAIKTHLYQPSITYSKLSIATLEQGLKLLKTPIVNFEHVSHLGSVSFVNFEQANVGWGNVLVFFETSLLAMDKTNFRYNRWKPKEI